MLAGTRRQGLGPERLMSSCPCWSEKWLFWWAKNTSAKSTEELYYCLYVWQGKVLSWVHIYSKTIFDKNLYLYCIYNFVFYVIQQKCWTAPSLTPAGSPLFVSSQFVDLVVRACLHSFHLSTHFSRFLIYVKPGLVGPRGTLFVSFIHPVNKNSSLVPEQQLTDDSQKWSHLFKPSSVYGLQAQCSIKVFVLFYEESHRVFFLRTVAPVYLSTPVKSVQAGQCLAMVDAAEI